ncbi:MAG TPA: hypothetical protein EYG72_00800 [Candidatus Pacebacteria bacterium]|nr:hypothetical protein [Candidatus Paceibacterota bacterium]
MFIKKIIFSSLLIFGILFSLNGVFAETSVNSNTDGSIFLENLPGLENLEEKTRAAFDCKTGSDGKQVCGDVSDPLSYYIG